MKRIKIDKRYIPYKWTEDLIANREIGGLLLVFVKGKTSKEINYKVKQIQIFCRKLKDRLNEDF